MSDLRSELLAAARAYCVVEAGDEACKAWHEMVKAHSIYIAQGFDGDPGPAVHAIGDYIEADDLDESDYLYFEEILFRPACGKCGADGYTVHHADSTTAAPIWQCAKCHHIGYG